jgi:hypothetical protein
VAAEVLVLLDVTQLDLLEVPAASLVEAVEQLVNPAAAL